MGYSQLKVDADGKVRSKNEQLIVGEDAGTGDANVLIGKDRTSDGKATFTLISDASAYPAWGTRMFRNNVGFAGFQHRGTGDLQFNALDNATITFYTNSAIRLAIRKSTGNLDLIGSGDAFKPGGGPWNTLSDKKSKNNIQKYTDGLKEVLALNTIKYKYKKDIIDSDREYIGVVAQELEEVAPYMVSNTNVIKSNGESTVDMKTVDPNAFTYMLINAVQEQQTIIDGQDDQISDLNDKIEMLEELVSTLAEKMDNVTLNDDKGVVNTNVRLENYEVASLEQNQPNPFTFETTIPYSLPSNFKTAKMEIYDLQGRLFKELSLDHSGKGNLNVQVDNLPSGTYTYTLVVDGNRVESKKMVIE